MLKNVLLIHWWEEESWTAWHFHSSCNRTIFGDHNWDWFLPLKSFLESTALPDPPHPSHSGISKSFVYALPWGMQPRKIQSTKILNVLISTIAKTILLKNFFNNENQQLSYKVIFSSCLCQYLVGISNSSLSSKITSPHTNIPLGSHLEIIQNIKIYVCVCVCVCVFVHAKSV